MIQKQILIPTTIGFNPTISYKGPDDKPGGGSPGDFHSSKDHSGNPSGNQAGPPGLGRGGDGPFEGQGAQGGGGNAETKNMGNFKIIV